MKAVGGKPVQGTFGIADAMIIAPGEPERSVLYYRMASLGGSRMPRVGSRAVDEKGLETDPPSGSLRCPNPGRTAASRPDRRGDRRARQGSPGREASAPAVRCRGDPPH